MMRRPLLLLCIMLLPLTSFATNMSPHSRPVVLELFTSQGCSSCPPADHLIGEIANRPEVIALTFHVDYWDYLGWRDPFASSANTQRQRSYARTLNLSSIFTPQLIIDGQTSVVGSDRRRVTQAIGNQPAEVDLTIKKASDQLTVDLPDLKVDGSFEVTAVAYQSYATTPVPHGENAGSTLKEYNVVRWLKLLGQWNGTAVRFTVKTSELPDSVDHLAVLVQKSHQGSVAGSAVIALK